MEFHERLREARLRAGLTQKEVAEAAGIGTDAGYRQYEIGKRTPGIELATRMADALGVSLDWLAGRTDKMELDSEN